MLLVGSVAGVLVALALRLRTAERYALLGLLTIAMVIGSAVAYKQMQYLCNPLVPVLAMVLAAELSGRVVHMRASRWRQTKASVERLILPER